MSFRRAAPSESAPLPAGARRGLSGAALVSSGLVALDAALGGGLPLGSLLLLEQDAASSLADAVVATLVAAAQAQNVVLLRPSLPARAAEEPEDVGEAPARDSSGAGLRIAWQ